MLKVKVGDTVYNLREKKRQQVTHTTTTMAPATVAFLLQQWKIKRNDKIKGGKLQKLLKSTKTISLNGSSEAISLPSIG